MKPKQAERVWSSVHSTPDEDKIDWNGHSNAHPLIIGVQWYVAKYYLCHHCAADVESKRAEMVALSLAEQQRRWDEFQASKRKEPSKEELRALPYPEFLETAYWQEVRGKVLARDRWVCQFPSCGSTKNLHVHHMTYEHHGEEHLHLEDLITWCGPCHTAFHGCEVQGLKNWKENDDVV